MWTASSSTTTLPGSPPSTDFTAPCQAFVEQWGRHTGQDCAVSGDNSPDDDDDDDKDYNGDDDTCHSNDTSRANSGDNNGDKTTSTTLATPLMSLVTVVTSTSSYNGVDVMRD